MSLKLFFQAILKFVIGAIGVYLFIRFSKKKKNVKALETSENDVKKE